MFYVLNFQSHTFASSSSIEGTLEAAQMLLDNGVPEDAVEIVNAVDGDDSRFSMAEFCAFASEVC